MYILGDLFEAWVGDDGADATALTVASALRELAEHGSSIFFVHGNRDFLLGPSFAEQSRMRLLQEPVHLPELEPATAVLHGDILCTDDRSYQRFRAKVRNPDWQARILARPLWWRRLLGRLARTISRRRNRGRPPEIMDVNAQAVRQCFEALGIGRLIHGHTHRPGIHRLEINGRTCERVVLGDWHGERGSVLRLDREGACLMVLHYAEGGDLALVPA